VSVNTATAFFATVEAEMRHRAADELQTQADDLKHWNPFPVTLEQKIEAEQKRLRWREAQAQVEGARRREFAAAYRAGAALIAEARLAARRQK
jgi:hypothetical protein